MSKTHTLRSAGSGMAVTIWRDESDTDRVWLHADGRGTLRLSVRAFFELAKALLIEERISLRGPGDRFGMHDSRCLTQCQWKDDTSQDVQDGCPFGHQRPHACTCEELWTEDLYLEHEH